MRFVIALLLSVVGSACLAQTEAARGVMETDRAFSRLAQERGIREAFLAYAAADAVMFREGVGPVRGHEAIGRAMQQRPGVTLTWEPEFADVAASGDLAYSWGWYVFTSPDKEGVARASHGNYVSIWRRQPDGGWKWVIDLGNPAPPRK